MKKQILYFILLCFAVSNTFAQKKPCNYITDYYPKMYQAWYASEVENDKGKAYIILKDLYNTVGLLGTPTFYEDAIYFSLAAENSNFKDAKKLAEKLVTEGTSNETLIHFAKGKNFLDSIEYNTLSQKYLATRDTSLIERFQFIHDKSQEYTHKFYLLPETGKFYEDSLQCLYKYADSTTKEYITKKGFTTGTKISDDGLQLMAWMNIGYTDSAYFVPTLEKYVQEGQCPPEIYAEMVDKLYAKSHDDLIFYGIGRTHKTDKLGNWVETTEKDFYDYANLNKRRIEAGLPTREMEKAFREVRSKIPRE